MRCGARAEEAFAAEVLAFALEWGVSGISVDWEYSYGNNQTCFKALVVRPRGDCAARQGFCTLGSNGGGW